MQSSAQHTDRPRGGKGSHYTSYLLLIPHNMGFSKGYGFYSFLFSAVLALASCEESPLKVTYAAKGSNLVLQCPSTASGVERSWYRGTVNELVLASSQLPGTYGLIFKQTDSGNVIRNTSRGELTVDSDSFALNINNIGDADRTFYTCVTYHSSGRTTFDVTRIKIHDPLPDVVVVHGEVNSNISLACPGTTSGATRAWYRGRLASNVIQSAYPYFNQSNSGSITNEFAYNGIAIDRDTFTLEFIGSPLHNRGYYTCVTITPSETTYGWTYLNVYYPVNEMVAEENSTVIIPGMVPALAQNSQWNHGYTGSLYVLVGGLVYQLGARPDMRVDNTTFNIIIGNVQLQDDTYFNILSTVYPISVDDITRLKVYIQPKPVITGLDNGPFKEGDTVTATCTVDRVYPALPAGFGFHLTWGGTTQLGGKSANADGSWKYSTQIMKTLTKADDKSTVSCTISPQLGNVTSKVMEVNFVSNCFPNPCENGGTCQESGSSYTCSCLTGYVGSKCAEGCSLNPCKNGGTCTNGVSTYNCACSSKYSGKNCDAMKGAATGDIQDNIIPIAAGAAGGGALLIIIIVIIACCCCKRRNKGSLNGSQSGEGSKSEYLNSAFHGENNQDYVKDTDSQ